MFLIERYHVGDLAGLIKKFASFVLVDVNRTGGGEESKSGSSFNTNIAAAFISTVWPASDFIPSSIFTWAH